MQMVSSQLVLLSSKAFLFKFVCIAFARFISFLVDGGDPPDSLLISAPDIKSQKGRRISRWRRKIFFPWFKSNINKEKTNSATDKCTVWIYKYTIKIILFDFSLNFFWSKMHLTVKNLSCTYPTKLKMNLIFRILCKLLFPQIYDQVNIKI